MPLLAPQPLTLADLSARCGGGEVIGDPETLITNVASLHGAQPGSLTFFSGGAESALAATAASAVLLHKAQASQLQLPDGIARWVVPDEPRLYFARVIDALYPPQPPAAGIAAAAVVDSTAKIADDAVVFPTAVVGAGAVVGGGCVLHPGVVVGAGAVVGAGTVLHPRVVLYPQVVVGAHCVLHAGVVIGADGFGYAQNQSGVSDKIRQLGSVRLGDHVEVGANTAIDCGALDDTVIGNGVKIDNLVQIGHNVIIGENTIICGKVGIAGSSTIGSGCMIGGGAGIAGHLHIGDNAKVAGASAVTRNIAPGEVVSSVIPAMPIRTWRRLVAGLRRGGRST